MIDYGARQGRAHLPWRKKNVTAYEIWVSEIMLQQTQVNRVIAYYNRFLEKFPNVFALTKATWKDFFPYYDGLGYYRRGRNMLTTAQMVRRNFGGEFPQDKKQLMSLPGIGEYTASAILTFAYKQNHLAFDTNLQKVFGRFLCGNKRVKVKKDTLEKKFKSNKGLLSAAIMDFANVICLNRPKCDECMLRKQCEYAKTNGRPEMKTRSVREKFPTDEAQVFLWLHKDHKEYYSTNPDRFEMFKLGSNLNTREKIKEYFRTKYGLELAVRPPHKKMYVDGEPTLFVNAQILLGEHEFGVFGKGEI